MAETHTECLGKTGQLIKNRSENWTTKDQSLTYLEKEDSTGLVM